MLSIPASTTGVKWSDFLTEAQELQRPPDSPQVSQALVTTPIFSEAKLSRHPSCGRYSMIGVDKVSGHHHGLPYLCHRNDCGYCKAQKIRKYIRQMTIRKPVAFLQLECPSSISYEEATDAFRNLIRWLRNEGGKYEYARLHDSQIDSETGEIRQVLWIFLKSNTLVHDKVRKWWREATGGDIADYHLLTSEKLLQEKMAEVMERLTQQGYKRRRFSCSPTFWDCASVQPPISGHHENMEWYFKQCSVQGLASSYAASGWKVKWQGPAYFVAVPPKRGAAPPPDPIVEQPPPLLRGKHYVAPEGRWWDRPGI